MQTVHDLVSILGWLTLVAFAIFLLSKLDQLGGGLAGSITRTAEEAEQEARERADYERLRVKFAPTMADLEAQIITQTEIKVSPRFRSRPSELSSRASS